MSVITETLAKKVLEVVDVGLSSGLGEPTPGKMCVEAAVCYALGEKHNDQPSCVHSVVRSFKITLNDSKWSSNEARAKGMRKIAIAQLGSLDIDVKKFTSSVAEQTIRKILPIALRSIGLIEEAERCEREGSQEAADAARAAADAYAADAYAADAAYAARAAADAYAADADAARAAAYAARAAAYAARAAADADAARAAAYAAADAADAAYAARAASEDRILSLAADIGTEALIQCGTEGSKFLYLCEG